MTDELRAWAKRCADVTRGRLPEFEIWDLIAERGEEWEPAMRGGKLYRGTRKMANKQCFYNSQLTVLGGTAFNARGCQYAEGFALSEFGWLHHGWVVLPDGRAMDRTWTEPGARYVGVTVKPEIDGGMLRCRLTDWPCGMAWGPEYQDKPELLDYLFDRDKRDKMLAEAGR